MNYGMWDEENNNLIKANKNLVNFLFEKSQLSNKKNMKILDIGCGYGEQDVEWLNKIDNTCKIIAVDISEKQIDYAREKNKNSNITFKICDAMELESSYCKNTFDNIFSVESAFHYPDRKKFFKNVNQILKNDGIFVISDITLKNSYNSTILTNLFIYIYSNFLHIPKNNLISLKDWSDQISSELNVIELVDITETTIEPYYNHFMTRYVKNKNLPSFLGNTLNNFFYSVQPFSYVVAVCKKRESV